MTVCFLVSTSSPPSSPVQLPVGPSRAALPEKQRMGRMGIWPWNTMNQFWGCLKIICFIGSYGLSNILGVSNIWKLWFYGKWDILGFKIVVPFDGGLMENGISPSSMTFGCVWWHGSWLSKPRLSKFRSPTTDLGAPETLIQPSRIFWRFLGCDKIINQHPMGIYKKQQDLICWARPY